MTQTIIVPTDTSFFKGPKAALKAFSEMALEEDQKPFFKKRFDLVEDFVLVGHKVISVLVFPFILFGN